MGQYIDKDRLHDAVEWNHGYHRPEFQETMDKMQAVRNAFKELGHLLVEVCPASEELLDVLKRNDRSCMLAIASLARNEPEGRYPNTTSHPKRDGE